MYSYQRDLTSRFQLEPIEEHVESMSTSSSTSTDDAAREDARNDEHLRKLPMSPTASITSESLSETDSFSWDNSYSSWRSDLSRSTNSLNGGINSGSNQGGGLTVDKSLLKGAHMSNERVRLTEVLEGMDSERIKDILLKRLQNKDSKGIVSLSVLFPRSSFPPVEHAHCVRCHREYSPRENTNCVIRHPTASVTQIKRDSEGTDFYCRSCRTGFRLLKMYFYDEKVNSYLSGFCFSGKHTANPRDVSYAGSAKTCEENGCVEFYV